MKGLFVKDIELMKQQKQFFILVVVMEVILNLQEAGVSVLLQDILRLSQQFLPLRL